MKNLKCWTKERQGKMEDTTWTCKECYRVNPMRAWWCGGCGAHYTQVAGNEDARRLMLQEKDYPLALFEFFKQQKEKERRLEYAKHNRLVKKRFRKIGTVARGISRHD